METSTVTMARAQRTRTRAVDDPPRRAGGNRNLLHVAAAQQIIIIFYIFEISLPCLCFVESSRHLLNSTRSSFWIL